MYGTAKASGALAAREREIVDIVAAIVLIVLGVALAAVGLRFWLRRRRHLPNEFEHLQLTDVSARVPSELAPSGGAAGPSWSSKASALRGHFANEDAQGKPKSIRDGNAQERTPSAGDRKREALMAAARKAALGGKRKAGT